MRLLSLGAWIFAACGRIGFDPPTDPYSAEILADDPVAYWRLGETTGTVARDEVDEYPGTYQGTCQLGVAGVIAGGDSAVQFDGTSCRVVIGNELRFSERTPFTIELWAKPDLVDGSVRWLVDRETESGLRTGYQLAFQNVALWFERFADDRSETYLGTAAPAVGRFQFFAFSFDGMRQRLFVDGVEVAAVDTTFEAPEAPGILVLGDNSRDVDAKFSGVIDEVAFFDHALSPARIAAHFAARNL